MSVELQPAHRVPAEQLHAAFLQAFADYLIGPFDLPFDRFVNPERARFSKMADIDLDLPWDQRDQVIEWVYERYGHDRVAMIGAANTYRARGAVAELGKVFGLAPSEVHQATRVLSYMTASNLPRSIADSTAGVQAIETDSPARVAVSPVSRDGLDASSISVATVVLLTSATS